VIGKPISIFSAPEGLDTIGWQALEELVKKGFFRNDVMACTKDGKRYPVEVTASLVMDERDEISQIVVVSRKIEERQRFEARLLMDKARKELLKDDLIGQLAPELRETKSDLEAVIDDLGPSHSDVKALERATEKIDGVLKWVDDAIADFDDPRQFEDLHPIAIDNAVEQNLPRILDRFRDRGVKIDVNLSVHDSGVEIMGNAMIVELLARIFRILVDLSTKSPLNIDLEVSRSFLSTYESSVDPEEEVDPMFVELKFSSPSLFIKDELRRVLSRREVPHMGALGPQLSYAIETARLLVFFFKGQIFIDDTDEDGKGPQRLVLLLPIAGKDAPAQQEPFLDLMSFEL
jgi:hypothetical protein